MMIFLIYSPTHVSWGILAFLFAPIYVGIYFTLFYKLIQRL